MLGTVAGTVACVCDFGRPEVAAACSFAAMMGGNMDDVRDITCKMIDQVSLTPLSWLGSATWGLSKEPAGAVQSGAVLLL